jgi:TldD protein
MALMFSFEDRFGLTPVLLRGVLDAALSTGGDFAEIYAEYRTYESVFMEEDIIKETTASVAVGLGIRVIAGDQTGYGYTNDLSPKRLLQTARSAAAIAASAMPGRAADLRAAGPFASPFRVETSPADVRLEDKMALVRAAYAACHATGKAIHKVKAGFQSGLQRVLIVNSEGLIASEDRPMVKLTCVAIAERNGAREYGFSGGGGRVGLEHFAGTLTPEEIGREAAREAIHLLEARPAPAGEMPVVLSPGHAGVLIHEAVGHLLEADFIRKKTSVFWNKLNKKVGSPLVTIHDDPTIPAFRGSYGIDDEGTVASKVTLIEDGIVRGLLQDRLSAKILRMGTTGHGRRQDYTDIPIPRMANTYIDPGETPPEDIVRSVKKGFYADRFQGGQVEDSGKFTFSVSSGWLIEDGRLTAPVKQATLIGSNLDVLKKIEMVGNDLGWSQQTGTCSKDGQDVPVMDGCPTLKISRMTVGGRE